MSCYFCMGRGFTVQPCDRQSGARWVDDAEPPQWVEVNASAVRVENCRQFGGPWRALELIGRLGLDESFSHRQREAFFHNLIDRVRRVLDVKRIKTIFGRQRRPSKRRGQHPQPKQVIEGHAHDLTVFKLHFGRLTLKVYTARAGD